MNHEVDALKTAKESNVFRIGGDLPIWRMGYGAMRITGPGIWGEPRDRPEAIRVLRRAVELGVNFIDTADSYGPAVSEQLIAEALYPYPSDLVIASKAGLERPGPDQWTVNGKPTHLRAACEGSLRRLRLERIDLFQLHRIDPKVPLEDQLGVLKDLQAQGKIRHIGLSEVQSGEIRRASAIVPIATVQNRYSIADRAHEETLEYCESSGIGFIPWFPLAAGDFASLNKALDEIAKRLKITVPQLALAWLLWRSRVMIPIPGTSSLEHLEENIAAATLQLDEAELRKIDQLTRRR